MSIVSTSFPTVNGRLNTYTMWRLRGGSSTLTCEGSALFCASSRTSTYLKLRQPLWIAVENAREPQLLELLLQTRGQAGVHGTSTRQDDCLEQTASDIDVGRLDGVEERLGNTRLFAVNKVRLEQTLRGLEALRSHADDAAIGKGVGLDQNCGLLVEALVEFEIV